MKEVNILKAFCLVKRNFTRALFVTLFVTPAAIAKCIKKTGFVQSLENLEFENHEVFEVKSAKQQTDFANC